MGKSNTEQLKIAEKYLGQGGARFRKYCGLPSGAAWCDAFVTYVFNEAGNASLFCGGKKQTYCPTTIKICAKDMAQVPMYLAMPSDVIFFDWERNGVPNHIGYVRSKVSPSSINTIEGNTSNKVMYKTRPAKYVQAIYRPHFKPAKMPTKGKVSTDGNFEYQSIYMLQVVLGLTPDAILGKNTVMALQRKAGLTGKAIDGAWGPATSKAIQSKLLGFKGKDLDGVWGKQSTVALQTWINKQYNPTPATKPTTTPTQKPTPKPYAGPWPDFVVNSGQKIAWTARNLAYAKGTKKAVYTYPKGKAKQSFTTAINKVYPNRKTWSKQCQAGASCDVGAGTIIRYSGIDTKIPRGLDEQIPHLKKSTLWRKTGQSKCSAIGDVGVQSSPGAHIWIYVGSDNVAEASHTYKYFEHIAKGNRSVKGKPNGAIYRATKATPISKGDMGTEVTKLQKFLNWYGLKVDVDGVCGPGTESAIKAFQKAQGLTPDGVFGAASLAKAKAVKK